MHFTAMISVKAHITREMWDVRTSHFANKDTETCLATHMLRKKGKSAVDLWLNYEDWDEKKPPQNENSWFDGVDKMTGIFFPPW